MHPLAHFNFEAHRVRVSVDERGEPWFVAADVCAALDIADSPNALGRLGDDEKGVGTTDTPGGIQRVATVNEPGVYRLVFTSQAAGAERFKRWLAHEVLPTLRRTEANAVPAAPPAQPRQAPSSPLQDQVLEHLDLARTLAFFIPGLKPELAAAHALDAIQTDTGLSMAPHRKALSAAAPPAWLNAMQLGQRVGLSAPKMNLRLEACGLQRQAASGEWELTDAGWEYAEAVPLSPHEHSACELLWRPEVLGVLEDAARSSAISVGLG
ncbi:BRO-N domain-containing protein [Myxococcus llanfairpwllgwyngyllgogerychwyrndrobwllllantysiliogogogochensis]|uniref:BRO-N domain-containing protein n=1 Tax=Myxococcus llanfairpwllgwyngyllgogerychwyrndrobwllllantysiliogogogochensis TaxID=2590453 RepID=UPI0015EFF794|nr:Bro-N domain-containing protein [Myxococcus llanfairpwllgwyngyllgogerychwyrndrobwllllantysiliogogogochensis]